MPEPHSTTIGIAVGAGIGLTGTVNVATGLFKNNTAYTNP